MKQKLMFYCQHVLGMGHLIRSLEIVRGLTDFDVYFLNGGELIPGLALPPMTEMIDLPPLKADPEFRDLQAAAPLPIEEVKAQRSKRILAAFDRVQPDVLVIELFPFGRLKFNFELMPLLSRARQHERTKIVCSLRDILVSKREQRQYEEDACAILNSYYDLLLIHADPVFQRLEETFPPIAAIRIPILYTGFVVQPAAPVPSTEPWPLRDATRKKILVSLGGGRVGGELIAAVLRAIPLITTPHQMLILTGPYLPEAEFAELAAAAAPFEFVRLEQYSPEFVTVLREADLSISMAGYNTCMNLLTTGVRALLYPFTGNNNQEQTIRAAKFQALGLAEMITAEHLSPAGLAEKISRNLAASRPPPAGSALDLTGVATTAAILRRLATNQGLEGCA